MPVARMIEKWSSSVNGITIGATSAEGGTRSEAIKIGGQNAMPFLSEEGTIPNLPAIAMEVTDMVNPEWPAALIEPFKDVIDKPARWAKKCQDEYKADAVCLRLTGAHPENKNTPIEEVVKMVKELKSAVSIPLIIWGCGNNEKDNQLFPAISQALKGERCLLGTATQDNYKILAATCIADGHNIVAESPLDINICKQLNILLLDMEMPNDRIVIFPSTGALGYGFEYSYSIMERTRLAALGGDKTMAYPMIAVVSNEVWKTKEAKAPESEMPCWGRAKERAIIWEATTAIGFLLAGADMLVMYHPKAIELTRNYIQQMMKT
ncbi:MAG: acetyl-CoA decarbonylase/synthase complex subunit delta [Planctomycetota bacterium]|nr:acetyl-CoA decarbonylase/synthase complex subunit delta [Planctomycetota bacterium]MDI6787401.1 acetyl-CoA decarbonylase/synthase complex subunit delta [Planctomycetota bacterium]